MATSVERRLQALEKASLSATGVHSVIQRLGETESEALSMALLPEDFRGLTVFIQRFSVEHPIHMDEKAI